MLIAQQKVTSDDLNQPEEYISNTIGVLSTRNLICLFLLVLYILVCALYAII